jgi:hypothetical protein
MWSEYWWIFTKTKENNCENEKRQNFVQIYRLQRKSEKQKVCVLNCFSSAVNIAK